MRAWCPFGLSAVLILCGSCAALRPHPSVRSQLEREYAAIVAGFKRDDPTEWIHRLGPEFQLTVFSGAVQNRNWVVNYVRNNAKAFHVVELTMTIKDLRISDHRAVATVEQKSVRTFTDPSGQHRLDVGALQQETRQRSAEGWKLNAVEEKQLLYLLRDGKPPSS